LSARLTDRWRLGPAEVVSAVGAGGKTSLLERLACDYEAEGARVLLTTTTKVLPPAPGTRPLILGETLSALCGGIRSVLKTGGPSPVAGRAVLDSGKLDGLPPDWVPALRDLAGIDAVLIEADGAARRPLKAPAPWEPVIPSCTSLVVALAGLDCQDTPLDEVHVHRPEEVGRLLGLSPGQIVPAGRLPELLLQAYGPATPATARLLLLFSKADRVAPRPALLRAVAGSGAEVWAGSTGAHLERLAAGDGRPAALVLAGGLGSRMGGRKMLAPLAPGMSLLGQVLRALAAVRDELSESLVVLGRDADETRRALARELGADMPRVLHNPSPEQGMSSSLKAAVQSGPGAADILVLLGDQPFVTAGTLRRLLAERERDPRAAAVALKSEDTLIPPLLMHRSLRPLIMELPGDQGARTLVRRFADRVRAVPCEGLEALDVDTPEQLERAQALFRRTGGGP